MASSQSQHCDSREKEWRIVDIEGSPYDPEGEGYPLYWEERHALDALELACDDGEEFHLEVRYVDQWQPAAMTGTGPS